MILIHGFPTIHQTRRLLEPAEILKQLIQEDMFQVPNKKRCLNHRLQQPAAEGVQPHGRAAVWVIDVGPGHQVDHCSEWSHSQL